MRQQTEGVGKRLEEMSKRLEYEFLHLRESVGLFLSESWVDCHYILHDGKGPMSLCLSHVKRGME